MWVLEFMMNGRTYFPDSNFNLLQNNSYNQKEQQFFKREEIPNLIKTFMEKYPEIDNVEAGQVAD